MSFRKRNVGLVQASSRVPHGKSSADSELLTAQNANVQGNHNAPGIRPSPLDGRPTTSTGTQTLDGLLAGHNGLALGTSILLEESGTTDYAGTLLRYYAAEGVVQGHKIHVVGVGEQWGRDLPGLAGLGFSTEENEATKSLDRDKMKIAWRYERLGEFGAGAANARGGKSLNSKRVRCVYRAINMLHGMYRNCCDELTIIASPAPNRNPLTSKPDDQRPNVPEAFCHTFDLTKKLSVPSSTPVAFIPIRTIDLDTSPFTAIIQSVASQLFSSPSNQTHRLVIPSLLSPALYPSTSSHPQHVLHFLHSLRALLRQHPTKLTAMITLPLTLYPRSTGLVRWMELLSDGVLELAPFPHATDLGPSTTSTRAGGAQEDAPQGMFKVHRLPIFHEKGGGGTGSGTVGEDFAFTVSRRKFGIKPFSLPPVEGDTEAQRGEAEGKPTKVDIAF